ITELLKDANMVFVTCGLGGGTGTGAAPVVAEISRSLGILTVGVVTKPFTMEGKKRMDNAIAGIETLKQCVDSLIVIPNDKILGIVDRRASIQEAFSKVDEVLHQSVQGVTELLNVNGTINDDFADLTTVMKDKGLVHIGIGVASGENKCMNAVQVAISKPLLETKIDGATSVLVNMRGPVSMLDSSETVAYVTEMAASDVEVFWGVMNSDTSDDTVMITVIATGMPEDGNGASAVQRGAFGASMTPRTNFPMRDGQVSAQGTSSRMNTQTGAGQQGSGIRTVMPNTAKVETPIPQQPAGGYFGSPDSDIKIPEFLQRKR
ncbi:MAG: cell division protein FtsZ, partial [Lachnospiraceae bacterium]|nr:cell division protein FtsZ [Lachnospiraceae bacterium]